MTGDYIKQLQLKKQIEQKAKEAAKSREAAEEMLVQAEESLKLTKKMDAPAAEAEKILTEASSFFKDKDYRSSLSLSTKSMDSSRKAQRDKVGSMLDAADELRTLVEKRGSKDEGLALMSQEARKALAKGSLEDSFSKAKELWDQVEKLVNRYMGTAFGEAQTVMLLAEGLGIQVDTERQSLAEARQTLEEEQVPASMERLASCLESLDAALKEKFSSRADSLMDVSQYDLAAPIDLTRVDRSLKKAEALLAQGLFEDAFSSLTSCEAEHQKALTRGFTAELQWLRKRGTVLKDNGIDIKDINSQIAAATGPAQGFAVQGGAGRHPHGARHAPGEGDRTALRGTAQAEAEAAHRQAPGHRPGERVEEDRGVPDQPRRRGGRGGDGPGIGGRSGDREALKGLAGLESELSRTRNAMNSAGTS